MVVAGLPLVTGTRFKGSGRRTKCRRDGASLRKMATVMKGS